MEKLCQVLFRIFIISLEKMNLFCYNIKKETRFKNMNKRNYIAEDVGEGIRISDFLKKKCTFSRTLITKVKFGGVFINGENVHMRATVHNGDTITVIFPDEDSENVLPINIPIEVLYEDEYIIALNKPRDMPTHPSRGNSLPTLANALSAHLGAPFVFRAINRLDRDTSGIVLVAKDQLTSAKLCASMKAHHFDKRYIAVISGVPFPSEGRINAPIAREREGEIKRVVRGDGKDAITDYKVIKELANGDSLCELTLHTGRTHQIRVHMAYIGHPLRDDFLYGEKNESKKYMLHCRSITFPHPIYGKDITVYAKADFENII